MADVNQVPVYKPGSAVCDALFHSASDVALRNKTKQYREGPIETSRGVWSTDTAFLNVKDMFSRVASKRPSLSESVDDFGRVYGNGIRSNWYGLRYVGGYPSIPATYPMVDNSFLREQAGLINHFREKWHEKAFRSYVRLFFTGLEPAALKLREGSSSMMPWYEKKMSKKIELAEHALAHGQAAGEAMLKGDYVTPWTHWYIGGAYHTVYRRQASDKMVLKNGVFIPKERPVGDLEYALSGGRSGSFSPTNRSLTIEGVYIPEGFFRERNRTAMGGPLGLNANLMVVAQPVRKHIYKEFAYTYHHTTRLSQQEDIRKTAYFVCADVSNHDWYWPTFVVPVIVDELQRAGWPAWWLKLFEVTFRLPNFVSDVGPGHDNILLGDWRNPSNNGGLPSGNAFTDILGSLVMSWVYMVMMIEHTFPEAVKDYNNELPDVQDAFTRSFLQGKQPITLKDKSDDAICSWTDNYLVPRAQKLQELMKAADAGKRPKNEISPYMIVSYEHGGAFLGSIMLFGTSKLPKDVVMIGNGNSLVVNKWSPEYGVQSGERDRSKVARPYPGLAWRTLAQNYGTCPAYNEILDLMRFCWGKHYDEDFFEMNERWYEDDIKALRIALGKESSILPDFTLIELEAMNRPSVLDWRYDEKDVRKEIHDLLFKGISLDRVLPHFNNIVPKAAQA